ncbi:MAG: zinc-ribbon domain containing protein [Blastocatellia bacterium]|nr:zinc-ribbon domain containing protein [Blastocatellia bacterium]
MEDVKEYVDQTLNCIECGCEFVFTAGEQLFFTDKGLKNSPKRCKPCKIKKNERFNALLSMMSTDGSKPRIQVAVECAQCGVNTTVPFLPTQGRPVYCRECFLKMQPVELVNIAKVAAPPAA